MKTWTVTALKGGIGKTPTTINLAGALTARGRRELLVELDPHSLPASYLGFDPDAERLGVHDLFAAAVEGALIDAAQLPRATNVARLHRLLPAATALVSLERRCGALKGMGRVLTRHLPALAERYDRCLVDGPPTLGMLVINALAAAELLLVPRRPRISRCARWTGCCAP